MTQIGDRLGCIESVKDGVLRLYGFGTYQGETVPPPSVGGFNIGIPNPTIKLDNGEMVYGCECWWGPEDEIKKQHLDGAKEIIVVKPTRRSRRRRGSGQAITNSQAGAPEFDPLAGEINEQKSYKRG